MDEMLARALELLEGLVDPDRCMYDHNAFCQNHMSGEPGMKCVNAQALDFLQQMGMKKPDGWL